MLSVLLATLGFGATFYVWTLLAEPGPELTRRLGPGSLAQGLWVAGPLAVGALGRLPVGLLTDRYGARVMLPAVSVSTAVPLVVVAAVQPTSAFVVLVGACGVAGTMFPIGVSVVVRCRPVERRGRALGVFGAGMAGAAVAGLTGPYALGPGGRPAVLLPAAATLMVVAVLAAVAMGDESCSGAREPTLRAVAVALRTPVVPPLAALSAVGSGTLIAVALYLPTYLHHQYGLGPEPTTLLTVGSVAVAAACRPLGGILADHRAATPALAGGFLVAAVGVLGQAFAPPLLPYTLLALAAVSAGLGTASGVLLALIGILAPPGRVGVIAGTVGAAGGVGALVLALLTTGAYAADDSFGIGLTILAAMLLAAVAHLRTRPAWIDFPAALGRVPTPAPTVPVAAAALARSNSRGTAAPGARTLRTSSAGWWCPEAAVVTDRPRSGDPPTAGVPWLLTRVFDQASLTRVRRAVAACATVDCPAGRPLEKFVLIVHEIMLNAVRHGGGRGRLRLWCIDDDLWCHIADDGPGIPPRYCGPWPERRPGDAFGVGGGLWLAAQVCTELRITHGVCGGTVVLLRYAMPPEPPRGAAHTGG